MLDKPWLQLANESEAAYTAFCQYLELPKKGDPPRRVLNDVAQQQNKRLPNLHRWSKVYDWEDRAEAYDRQLMRPTEIAELEVRRQMASEWRELGRQLRSVGAKAIEELQDRPLSTEDAIRLVKMGVELEEKADKLQAPELKNKRGQLISDIRKLITGGMGELVGGSTSGTVSAVEVTRSVTYTPRSESVREVPAIPGEICEGSLGGDVVERTDSGSPLGPG
jgi:hypothetical protein